MWTSFTLRAGAIALAAAGIADAQSQFSIDSDGAPLTNPRAFERAALIS